MGAPASCYVGSPAERAIAPVKGPELGHARVGLCRSFDDDDAAG